MTTVDPVEHMVEQVKNSTFALPHCNTTLSTYHDESSKYLQQCQITPWTSDSAATALTFL